MKTIKHIALYLTAGLLTLSAGADSGRAVSQSDIERLMKFQLSPVEKAPWRFEKFPILAWWAPSGAESLEDFENYRDAGFTLYPLNPDLHYKEAYEKARQVGLPVIAFRETQGFQAASVPVDFETEFPNDDDSVVGWITRDEPGHPDDVMATITAMHELMATDPTRWAFYNHFPPHAQPEPGSEAVVRVALKNGLPIISYDHYVMRKDGTTRRGQHFENLDLFRRLSLEHDVPFWAFALSIEHYSYRRPSESDVMWKQFTNLAYGAKGLWYFTYWAPAPLQSEPWPRWKNIAIVGHEGEKTDLYDPISKLNHEVQRIGDLLLDLTSTEVVHLNAKEHNKLFVPGEHWITEVSAKDVIIGFFKDGSENNYALIVNNLQGPGKKSADLKQRVTSNFASEVIGIEAISWLDGKPGPLQLDEKNRTTVELGGGMGILIKAQR